MAAGLKPEVWYLLFITFVSKWVEGVVRACGPLRAVYQSTRIYRKSRMGLRRCHSLGIPPLHTLICRACSPLRAVYQSTRICRKSRMGLRRCHSLASNVLPFFLSRHPCTPPPHLQGLWSTSCCVPIHENLQKKSHGLETLYN